AAKPEDIMDVNQCAVKTMMQEHNVKFLIHGHTHRPGVHSFILDGHQATRVVLGAWHKKGSVLCWNTKGFQLKTFPR
ncbi:MAG: UDP-2,3-diacylglucosamine diphosphatase, partial [Gammaproteobacteria bacterium]